MKQDVVRARYKLLKEVDRTFITLIPKSEDAKNIKEYMPISLCNFLYKIISKVLVSWMRLVLHNIISANQFTFIHGRSLLDASLLVKELIGDLKAKDLMCIEVDIVKAYDTIKWPYIIKMLHSMGFLTVGYHGFIFAYHQPPFKFL